MAIYYNKRSTSSLTAYGKVIQQLHYGAILIWEAVRSCFGSGMWVSAKPWIGTEAWKNNK